MKIFWVFHWNISANASIKTVVQWWHYGVRHIIKDILPNIPLLSCCHTVHAKRKIALDLKSPEYIGWKVQGCRRPKSWFSKWIVAPRGFAVSVSQAPAVFNFSTKCRNQGHRDIFAIQSWNEIESNLLYEASVILVKLLFTFLVSALFVIRPKS